MEQTAEFIALPQYEKDYARDFLAELNKVQSVEQLAFEVTCVQLDVDDLDQGRKVALYFYLSQHVTF